MIIPSRGGGSGCLCSNGPHYSDAAVLRGAGLPRPTGRLVSGHRVYANEDLRRLYRISLLRQLGFPLSDIAGELKTLARSVRHHRPAHWAG